MGDMKHGGNVWEGAQPSQWMDFSANLRPEGPPEWVMEALRGALDDVRYYPDRSMKAAREGLAEYLEMPKECVLPTAGGAAAIDLTLSRRRGAVYVLPVTFGEYEARAAVYGRKMKTWSGTCGQGDTVMLCNPNNPTGQALSCGEMLAVYNEVNRAGGELIADEAFIEYCPENSVRRYAAENLTVVGSMTKILCVPGVRLGYVCAVPATIKEIEERMLPWSLGALASAVARALPEHREEISEDVRHNRERRSQLIGLLNRLGAQVWPSQGSFVLADFHRDMTQPALLLREKGILVRTCASFGLGPEIWRLAVKTEEENLHLAECLEAIIHAG